MSRGRDPRRAQVETLFAGGWTDPYKIQALMARDGSTPPTIVTIRKWTDPEFAQRQRRASRDYMRRRRDTSRLPNLTEAEMWELALKSNVPRRRYTRRRGTAHRGGEAAQPNRSGTATPAGAGRALSSAAPPERRTLHQTEGSPAVDTTTTPDPFTPQRHRALDRANDIRLARADLKRRIAAGEVFAASVILDPPAEAQTWQIGQLIVSQRRWGETRMRNLLSRLQISETKAASALTDRQRRQIARALGQPGSEDQ